MKTFTEKLQREQKHNKQKKAKRVIRNIILSPLILISMIADKISDYNYKRMKWSEEKIKNLLDKYLPIILTKENLIDEDGGFLIERYTEYGFNASYIHTYMEKKDRRYYSKFLRAATDYLMNDYLIYGYEKYTPEHWESFKKEAGVFFKSDWPVGSAVYFKKFNKRAWQTSPFML